MSGGLGRRREVRDPLIEDDARTSDRSIFSFERMLFRYRYAKRALEQGSAFWQLRAALYRWLTRSGRSNRGEARVEGGGGDPVDTVGSTHPTPGRKPATRGFVPDLGRRAALFFVKGGARLIVRLGYWFPNKAEYQVWVCERP